MKKRDKKIPDVKTKNLKYHTENDFARRDKLIGSIGGRRIELDKKQQKQLLEFIYAIGTREEAYDNKKAIAKLTEQEKKQGAMTATFFLYCRNKKDKKRKN